MKYQSQYKQDEFIDTILEHKNNGIFVDIGAWDGVRYSNSYFFETYRNWTGVCVEPLPKEFKKLKDNRKCICLNYAISTINGKKKFLMIDHPEGGGMLSGLVDGYNKAHMKRVNKFKDNSSIIEVECKNINDLLIEYKLYNIDYCSIDVEGIDFDILKDINFNKFNITLISIENNYKDNIKNFMYTKNYEFIKKLGCDEVYKKWI